MRTILLRVKSVWKLLISTVKHDWTIDDYPIDAHLQEVPKSPAATSFKPIPWVARVVNWPAMSGHGNTKSEALEELRKNFDEFKATKRELPRPGKKVRVEFASSNRVDQHSELAKDFLHRILEVRWAWISDESTLGDFHTEETNDRVMERIRHHYEVDVSDISSGNLVDIFDRIAKHRVHFGE